MRDLLYWWLVWIAAAGPDAIPMRMGVSSGVMVFLVGLVIGLILPRKRRGDGLALALGAAVLAGLICAWAAAQIPGAIPPDVAPLPFREGVF